ncbi:hypothetical protein, partial [Paraburkholderia aspalathi]|uniref:hypothetical protein n=1 Tax=Paraburkholderia aspalathi TaxID=1324617 RepID=UPI001BA74135
KTGVSMTLNAVLELYAGKLARTVLRGPRFQEGVRLPSQNLAVCFEITLKINDLNAPRFRETASF